MRSTRPPARVFVGFERRERIEILLRSYDRSVAAVRHPRIHREVESQDLASRIFFERRRTHARKAVDHQHPTLLFGGQPGTKHLARKALAPSLTAVTR